MIFSADFVQNHISSFSNVRFSTSGGYSEPRLHVSDITEMSNKKSSRYCQRTFRLCSDAGGMNGQIFHENRGKKQKDFEYN